jgi:hypothetical protein
VTARCKVVGAISSGPQVASTQHMRIAPLSQGLFYLTTGLWPIANLPSLEAVTGRKRDDWLVQVTGGLIAVVGAALVVGAFERRTRALRTLGIASAAALGAADVYFAGKGRISPVYFADAVVEGALIALWLATDVRAHDAA